MKFTSILDIVDERVDASCIALLAYRGYVVPLHVVDEIGHSLGLQRVRGQHTREVGKALLITQLWTR